MIDNEIIQEATEAVEKGLDAGYAVEPLLRIVKSQKAEIERLQCSAKRHGKRVGSLIYHLEQAKSEAYREFAERFNDLLKEYAPYDTFHIYEIKDRIDIVEDELTEKKDLEVKQNAMGRSIENKPEMDTRTGEKRP